MRSVTANFHYPFALMYYATALALLAVLVLQGVAAQNCGCSNNLCCSQYGYCGSSCAYCGSGCQSGPCTGSSCGSGGSGSSGWSSFFTQSVFESFFPNRNSIFTYQALQTAAQSYPAFGTTGSSDNQKREVAAFCAHINQESGGLQYTEEIDKSGNYCVASTQYPCAAGKQYYGRGPLQISYNYNYGAARDALSLDLLNNPDQVAEDGTTSFKTAFWFWMTQKSAQTETCHDAMTGGTPSFSTTNRIINNIECGNGSDARVTARVQYYENFCQQLGVDPGTDLYCT